MLCSFINSIKLKAFYSLGIFLLVYLLSFLSLSNILYFFIEMTTMFKISSVRVSFYWFRTFRIRYILSNPEVFLRLSESLEWFDSLKEMESSKCDKVHDCGDYNDCLSAAGLDGSLVLFILKSFTLKISSQFLHFYFNNGWMFYWWMLRYRQNL